MKPAEIYVEYLLNKINIPLGSGKDIKIVATFEKIITIYLIFLRSDNGSNDIYSHFKILAKKKHYDSK